MEPHGQPTLCCHPQMSGNPTVSLPKWTCLANFPMMAICLLQLILLFWFFGGRRPQAVLYFFRCGVDAAGTLTQPNLRKAEPFSQTCIRLARCMCFGKSASFSWVSFHRSHSIPNLFKGFSIEFTGTALPAWRACPRVVARMRLAAAPEVVVASRVGFAGRSNMNHS